MKKFSAIGILTVLILFLISGCNSKRCSYCDGADIKYEALFVPSGTYEYYCEECYQERNDFINNYSTPVAGDDLWIINPIP